jgi:hypothetical protein
MYTTQPAGASGIGFGAAATVPEDPPPPHEASSAPARQTPNARAGHVERFKIYILFILQH